MSRTRLKRIISSAEERLLGRGAEMSDCEIVQPAEPFLDMAGEDLRRRIFLTQSADGETMCLRPEFTIPVCMSHIADEMTTPRRYGYIGQVFRQRRAGKTEFYQAGIEDFGQAGIADADAQIIDDAIDLTKHLNNDQAANIILGDQAVFAAVLKALGLPEGWQERLLHAFGDAQSLDLMLAQLAAPKSAAHVNDCMAPMLINEDHGNLTEQLRVNMEKAGYRTNASRTPEDIARRMLEKQRLANVSLSENQMSILREFLALEVPLSEAKLELEQFAGRSGLDVSDTIGQFSARLEAMTNRQIELSGITYKAAFGRPLDYYTGLVFEVQNAQTGDVLAAGGRYDRLMTLLGAENTIPAVGFSLWLDRFEVAS